VQDFSTSAADSAGPSDVLRNILSLVTKQQLVAASAIAAASGDVRLATLIAQVTIYDDPLACHVHNPHHRSQRKKQPLLLQAGTSKQRSQVLAQQVATWQAAGFSNFFDDRRLRLYQLLAGDVASTAANLELGWQPALSAHLG
jgi:hypothetical protein